MSELMNIVMEARFMAGFLVGVIVGACTVFCFMAMAIGRNVQKREG